MSEILTPFSVDPRGRAYACADGPEIYVYSGVDDSPLWRDFVDGILVGVAIRGDLVVAIDADGHLISWRLFDGQRVDAVPQDVPARGLAVDPHGGLALLLPDAVRVVSAAGHAVEVPLPGVRCVARDPSGRTVLAGTDDGALVWIDAMGGGRAGTVHFDDPVRDLAWSPHGGWIAAVGDRIAYVAADPVVDAVQGQLPVGAPVERVAVSQDGWLVAARLGLRQVGVFDRSGGERLATVTYERSVGDVAFAQETWLAIALEHADVNRLELGTGRLTRNAPGLGRASDPWQARVDLDPARLRGALARARAGGAPVAVQVERPKNRVSAAVQRSDRPKWVVPALVGVVVLSCCGCSGIAGLLAALR